MYTKKSTRTTFKSNRRPNFRRNNNYSNGKHRNKGNVSQQYNKFLKLAKEASTSGDRIQSEYYYQFTDHYYRLMVELGINIDDNDNIESKSYSAENSTSLNDKENIKINNENNSENNENNLEKNTEDDDANIESIESIPFIAEPAKKKRARNLK